jgi:hypothetical protein
LESQHHAWREKEYAGRGHETAIVNKVMIANEFEIMEFRSVILWATHAGPVWTLEIPTQHTSFVITHFAPRTTGRAQELDNLCANHFPFRHLTPLAKGW